MSRMQCIVGPGILNSELTNTYAIIRSGDDALLNCVQKASRAIRESPSPVVERLAKTPPIMICTTLCLSLLLLNQAIAATIPAHPSLFQNALDDAARTNQSAITGDPRFQYTGPATVQEGVQCDGDMYGTQLDLQSCNNALLRFNGDDTRLLTFGQRGFIPPPQQPLPLRRSSSESSALTCLESHVRPDLLSENSDTTHRRWKVRHRCGTPTEQSCP